jgi:hypothetical protein
MPLQTLTDDDVLRVMTELGFDGADELSFRITRHYLTHSVPKCCILHSVGLIAPLEMCLPDVDTAEELIKHRRGMKRDFGLAKVLLCRYKCIVHDAAGCWLNYTPCPACVLQKSFVRDIPEGCPCCQDEAAHPSPA